MMTSLKSLFVATALFCAIPSFASEPVISYDEGVAYECSEAAADLMRQYVAIFDLGDRVTGITLHSFDNTTPGSYNQEYEAKITLTHYSRTSLGAQEPTKLLVTFSSPIGCDDLKILSVVAQQN